MSWKTCDMAGCDTQVDETLMFCSGCMVAKEQARLSTTAPPVAVMPRNIWTQHRIVELADAIKRFIDKGETKSETIYDMVDELSEHVHKLRDFNA